MLVQRKRPAQAIPEWRDCNEYDRNFVVRRLMDVADALLKEPPSERGPRAMDREAACRSAIMALEREARWGRG